MTIADIDNETGLALRGRELLFTEARTANNFAPTPVSDDQLREIWELARWAPTAANTQPLRVLYVRTDEGRARLVEQMMEGNRAKTASAPVVAVLAVDTDFHEYMPTLLPYKPELGEYFGSDDAIREGRPGSTAPCRRATSCWPSAPSD